MSRMGALAPLVATVSSTATSTSTMEQQKRLQRMPRTSNLAGADTRICSHSTARNWAVKDTGGRGSPGPPLGSSPAPPLGTAQAARGRGGSAGAAAVASLILPAPTAPVLAV